MKKNAAVIGYGGMGAGFHVKNILTSDVVQLAGIYDIDPAKQAKAAADGVKVYESREALLADPAIDMVTIATPNDVHEEIAVAALEAGKNVISEKPVTLSLESLERMIAAAKKAGKVFSVHQNRRFDVDAMAMKQIHDSGEIGKVINIESRIHGSRGIPSDWRGIKKYGGGMLYDWGVHLIDQMLWMIPGKVSSVYANMRNVINEKVDDYFHIMLRFESGMVAEIELGTYYLTDREHWFERHWFLGGDKGSAYVDGFEPVGKIARTEHLLKNVGSKRTITAAGPTRSFGPPPEGLILIEDIPAANTKHEDYFKNYLNALEGKEEFLVKIEETRRVLRLMDAIRESARTGKSVDFES